MFTVKQMTDIQIKYTVRDSLYQEEENEYRASTALDDDDGSEADKERMTRSSEYDLGDDMHVYRTLMKQ
jgi:hypothetical protein